MTISIHRASAEERRQAHQNSHEAWGGDGSVNTYLESCFSSPRHNRAEWWVLTVDSKVASSLALHPLSFNHQGQTYSGFGIGSVHTQTIMRNRGYAMALCRATMDAAIERGDKFGLLFSDVNPSYYARLGFEVCPHERFICSDLPGVLEGGTHCQLTPFEGSQNLDFLMQCYKNHHQSHQLRLSRDAAEWRFLLDANADLTFLKLCDKTGSALGYCWVYEDESQIIPVEVILNQPTLDMEVEAYRALAKFAVSRSILAAASSLLAFDVFFLSG